MKKTRKTAIVIRIQNSCYVIRDTNNLDAVSNWDSDWVHTKIKHQNRIRSITLMTETSKIVVVVCRYFFL